MKYGIITYKDRPMKKGVSYKLNIGDPIQTYAMRYIYSQMGIRDDDLVEISRYHARYYDGEYVVLPFNCYNMIFNQQGHEYGTFPLSEKIIPVFLSFHLHSREFSEDIRNNLYNYQPIGCRDEETMNNMRAQGLRAWLSGCATAVLPKREKEPKIKKVFLVDVPKSLIPYIPKDIMDISEVVEHQIPFSHNTESDFMPDEIWRQFNEKGISQLMRYKEEATLVITSRLHAATPCMALGIPVILAGNRFDGRFSFLDKYLRFYTPSEFNEIDWNPKPVDYENEKRWILNTFIRLIKKTYDNYSDIYGISDLYETRKKEEYNADLKKMMSKLPIAEKSNVKFGIWGINSKSLRLKNYILDTCNNWKFEAVIDKMITGSFEGIEVKKPEDIEKMSSDILYFIVPESAHDVAGELLKKHHIKYILVKEAEMEYNE